MRAAGAVGQFAGGDYPTRARHSQKYKENLSRAWLLRQVGTAEWEHADVEAALFALAEWPVATRPENYRCAMTADPPGHARARVVDVGAMSVVHASLGCVNLALSVDSLYSWELVEIWAWIIATVRICVGFSSLFASSASLV